MKKRAMKKYIPEGIYCYDNNKSCKWWKRLYTKRLDRSNCEFAKTCEEKCWEHPDTQCEIIVCKCEYLNYIDREQDSLLFDSVKECGVKRGDF